MNRKKISSILFLICLTILLGCYNDKEEYLYPKAEVCDTNGVTSYVNTIEPILSKECYKCHSSDNNTNFGGGLNLEGHSNVFAATQNNLLISAIKREAGVSPMPKNATKLSDCKISTIEKWINEGGLNN